LSKHGILNAFVNQSVTAHYIFFFQKKSRNIMKEVSLAEAGKLGTFTEFAFFDKVSTVLYWMAC